MARFWVGGTNTWNATATGKWSATSGGASGASVPDATQDVFFDALSTGTCTLSTGIAARSINCTGFTGTISQPASTTVSIGDGTAGATNIALKTVAGMTLTVGSATTSIINFVSTSATQQDLTTGGKTWPSYTINGTGSSYRCTDANTIAATSTCTLTAGILDTNGQACSWGIFISNGTTARTLTLGASSITVTTTWNLSTTTNLTFNPNTSTITQTAGNATFQGGNLTYNNVTLNGNAGSLSTSGNNTYNNLSLGGFASGRIVNSGNWVVTGTFTMASSSATAMSFLLSSVRGTPRTITAANTSLTNHNIQDVTAAGAAAWTSTNVGDMGGNTGITFAAPVTRYWVATTGGSWNATTSWSTVSGGASGASIPLCHDTAVFDSNSITSGGRTITVNVECVPTLDFRNVLNSPTIAQVITNGIIYVKGSAHYVSGLTMSGTSALTFHGRGSDQITSGGNTITNVINAESPGGTVTLQDNLTTSNILQLNYGTLDLNNKNVTVPSFTSSVSTLRTLTMGSGTLTLTGTGTVWTTATSTNFTLNSDTSTIVISDLSAVAKTFSNAATQNVFYNLNVTAGGASSVNLANSARYNGDLTLGAPNTILFGAGSSKTIIGNFNATGTPGNVITIQSSTGGTPFTISKASGTVSSDYLSIQDSTATGGASWYAGANSTDVSGNTGWIFTAPPLATVSSNLTLLGIS